jgi:hypothetical protein
MLGVMRRAMVVWLLLVSGCAGAGQAVEGCPSPVSEYGSATEAVIRDASSFDAASERDYRAFVAALARLGDLKDEAEGIVSGGDCRGEVIRVSHAVDLLVIARDGWAGCLGADYCDFRPHLGGYIEDAGEALS